MGKFVITKRVNGELQFNLKAGNGQTILQVRAIQLKWPVITELNRLEKILRKIADTNVKNRLTGNFILI